MIKKVSQLHEDDKISIFLVYTLKTSRKIVKYFMPRNQFLNVGWLIVI